MPHGINLWTSFRSSLRKQVSFWDTIAPIFIYFYAQYFTAQVIGIPRGTLSVVLLLSRKIVQGSKSAIYIFYAFFIKGSTIISCGQV